MKPSVTFESALDCLLGTGTTNAGLHAGIVGDISMDLLLEGCTEGRGVCMARGPEGTSLSSLIGSLPLEEAKFSVFGTISSSRQPSKLWEAPVRTSAVETTPVVVTIGSGKMVLVLGISSSEELEATGVAGESSSRGSWVESSLGSSTIMGTGDVFGVEFALLRSIGDKLRSARDESSVSSPSV